MAVIKRSTKKGTARYAVTWTEGGRRREKWFLRQTDARAFDAEVKLRKRRRDPVIDDTVTVRELAREWWEAHASLKQRRTRDKYAAHLRNRICPNDGSGLGEYRAVDLDTRVIQAWIVDLAAAGHGAVTINDTVRVLKNIFAKAVQWQLAPRNPVVGVSLLPVEKRSIEVYQAADIIRLAEAAGQQNQRDFALILTAAFTGMRISEVFALQWQDVRDNTIRVDRALDEDRTFKPPKSWERRVVPLFDIVATALTDWRSIAPRGTDLVFPQQNGKPLHESNWNRRVWQPARLEAGIPRARFHELRHTFASMSIEMGVSVILLSRWLGHKKPSITLDVYGHLYADADAAYSLVNEQLNSLVNV